MLKDFLQQFPLNIELLKSVKNRIMVVGRFNRNRRKNGQPEVFLFTDKSELNASYQENFTDAGYPAVKDTKRRVASLDFNTFVREVQPTIAERIELVDGKYKKVTQVAPSDAAADQEAAATTVGPYNYFILRAAANTKQPAMEGDRPRLDSDVLGLNTQPGESVFIQIRHSLRQFSSFQQKHPALTELVADIFSRFAQDSRAISAKYAGGNLLPGGFQDALIDYLYAEDESKPFNIERLDLSDPLWGHLHPSASGPKRETSERDEFRRIIAGFRNFLLSKPQQTQTIALPDGTSLSTTLSELAPTLPDEFRKSHDSFNTLRQILRSKVLLSMVARWMLSGYYELPTVKQKRSEPRVTPSEVHQAIQLAILQPIDETAPNKWATNRVPGPIARPNRQEREEFSLKLRTSLRPLIDWVLSDDPKTHNVKTLPKELESLADALRKNPKTIAALKEITGYGNKEFYDASFIAFSTILTDVVCPVLYREPLLSASALSEELSRTTISTYLEAIYLTKESEQAFRKVGLDNQQVLAENISSSGEISSKDLISSKVLGSLLAVLTAQSDRVKFMRNFRIVKRVQLVLNNYTSGPQTTAAISATSSFDNPKSVTAKQPPVPKELIREIVRSKATKAASSTNSRGASPLSENANEIPQPIPGVAEPPKSRATEKTETRDGVSDPLLNKIDEILAKLPEARKVGELIDSSSVVDDVTKEVIVSPEAKEFASDLQLLDQARHLIYTRYNEQKDKVAFRNNVERMTLANLLLLFKEDLGLGRGFSNQYALLLDLIVAMNPEAPDLQDFIRAHSLTEYFDNSDFQDNEGHGFTRLTNILDSQSDRSLKNLVNIMSELQGIKYLLRQAPLNPNAEIVVVNATAGEFLDWLKADNLTPDQGSGCMRADQLVQGKQSNKLLLPGLIYFNDLAFESAADGGTLASKLSFLTRLRNFELANGAAQIVMPPICLAPDLLDWSATGDELAKEAETIASAVMIVGPAALLNPAGDRFPTVLPPGYLFCAHLLGNKKQDFQFGGVLRKSAGRFRVIGATTLSITLREACWPSMRPNEDNSYCFSGDFYLYLLALLLTGVTAAGTAVVDPYEFYRCFYYADDVAFPDLFESSKFMNPMMLGENMLLLSLGNIPSNIPLGGLRVASEAGSIIDDRRDGTLLTKKIGDTAITLSHVWWFNQLKKQLGLP